MRDHSIDIVSSLFIAHMVFLHIMQMSDLTDIAYFRVSMAIFACFMPWFFFKSGLFFKVPNDYPLYALDNSTSRANLCATPIGLGFCCSQRRCDYSHRSRIGCIIKTI